MDYGYDTGHDSDYSEPEAMELDNDLLSEENEVPNPEEILQYAAEDAFMSDYHEGKLSDVPGSNGDWYELGTPPPPPPPLPSDSISENRDKQDELGKMSTNNSKRRLPYMFGLKSITTSLVTIDPRSASLRFMHRFTSPTRLVKAPPWQAIQNTSYSSLGSQMLWHDSPRFKKRCCSAQEMRLYRSAVWNMFMQNRCTRLPSFLLQPNARRRLTGFLRTNDKRRTFHQRLLSIPERCERWGRLQVTDGGDCIRSASATNALSSYGKRDASFIKTKKMRNNKEVEMVKVFGYGRLNFILALNLPAAPKFSVNEPHFHILAHTTKAKDARGDTSIERVSYIKLGRSFVLDMTSVKHVVG
ncbi:Transposase family Tnp2 protein [Ceratobasidium sp. AG-Ba]|nr:Transposase family Tnp2 protein [Ceratobasidium sp. AG-Ba]